MDKEKEKSAEQQSIILGKPQGTHPSQDKDKKTTEKKEEPLKSAVARDIGEMNDTEFEKAIEREIERNKREDEQEFLRRIGFREQEKNGKTQFSKWVDEGVIVGITYNNANPNGRIWGFRDSKPINTDELKKMEEFKQLKAFRRGEVEMPELPAVPTPRREIQTKTFEKRGGVYKVGGHEEPDAWLVQQWANQAGVSTEIIEATQTTEYAKAIVRARMGDQFVDESVIHVFDTLKESLALEIVEKMEREKKKAIEDWDEEGRPILSGEARRRIYERFLRFKMFAVRDAITKAARRAQLKIMNKEWREAPEIEAEEREIKMVHEEE